MRWRHAIAVVLLAIALGDAGLGPAPQNQIHLDGLNALIVTDTSQGSVSPDAIWLHPDVTTWTATNTNGFYIWDDSHTDFDLVDDQWRLAYERAIDDSKGQRPWLLASGTRSVSQPLPTTATGLLDVLEACK